MKMPPPGDKRHGEVGMDASCPRNGVSADSSSPAAHVCLTPSAKSMAWASSTPEEKGYHRPGVGQVVAMGNDSQASRVAVFQYFG